MRSKLEASQLNHILSSQTTLWWKGRARKLRCCCIFHCHLPLPEEEDEMSLQRAVAATTASMIALRKLCFSSACKPLAVLPAGDVTLSLRIAGWSVDSMTNFPDPITVCAASRYAKSLGRPIFTPPSASASISTKIYNSNRRVKSLRLGFRLQKAHISWSTSTEHSDAMISRGKEYEK